MEYKGKESDGDQATFLNILDICHQLRAELNCDFVALAIQNDIGPDIKWPYVSGNRNEKYKRITVRYGKGIAGKVISTGRPMMISDLPNDKRSLILEHPIMLAEQLLSAYAAPLFIKGTAKGALLAGNRYSHPFTEIEQNTIANYVKKLEEKFISDHSL